MAKRATQSPEQQLAQLRALLTTIPWPEDWATLRTAWVEAGHAGVGEATMGKLLGYLAPEQPDPEQARRYRKLGRSLLLGSRARLGGVRSRGLWSDDQDRLLAGVCRAHSTCTDPEVLIAAWAQAGGKEHPIGGLYVRLLRLKKEMGLLFTQELLESFRRLVTNNNGREPHLRRTTGKPTVQVAAPPEDTDTAAPDAEPVPVATPPSGEADTAAPDAEPGPVAALSSEADTATPDAAATSCAFQEDWVRIPEAPRVPGPVGRPRESRVSLDQLPLSGPTQGRLPDGDYARAVVALLRVYYQQQYTQYELLHAVEAVAVNDRKHPARVAALLEVWHAKADRVETVIEKLAALMPAGVTFTQKS